MKIAGLLTGAIALSILLPGSPALAEDVILQIEIQNSLNYTSDHSSIDLTFSDFSSGSVSNTVTVQYSLIANNVGRSQGVLSARLQDLFPGIDFQARPGTYTKRSGNAHLVPALSGFAAVSTEETGLADKVTEEGDGKLVDGEMFVDYRAVLTTDQPAGQQTGVLVVSFTDN